MATVYLQPGTGTGSGTKADPYYYSELGTAETAAGNGGTILFTDGDYDLSANATFDGGGFATFTYQSENKWGANIKGLSSVRTLTLGSASSAPLNFKDFKTENLIYQTVGTSTSTVVSIDGIKHTDTFGCARSNGLLHAQSESQVHEIKNSDFYLKYISGRSFRGGGAIITQCTFYYDNSLVTSDITQYFSGTTGSPTSTNTIFSSNDSTKFSGAFTVSKKTNCCLHDVGLTSGGTNNIFVDPQFVDSADGDFRLRPTSPCIGAGTAS